MQERTITYQCSGRQFQGFLVFDETTKVKRPALLVAHAWKGQDDFAREKARELARLGYVGFAADVYGNGISVHSDEEAQALMVPLFVDRKELQNRIVTAYNTLKEIDFVDKERLGAIGFCFGGLTAIELMRSGVDLKGVVSFHGVLGNEMKGLKAKRPVLAEQLKGALLILHGHDDPLVSLDDILAIQDEMTKARVDWQMDIYGHTKHAFTNPQAHEEKMGLVFNEKSSRRSWQSMRNFFEEVFT